LHALGFFGQLVELSASGGSIGRRHISPLARPPHENLQPIIAELAFRGTDAHSAMLGWRSFSLLNLFFG
jgi:hypothetical protein